MSNDAAELNDEVTAAVGAVKGPDPDHWGEGQLIVPEGEPGFETDYEVKGPDPEHWGTDEERDKAEAERIASQDVVDYGSGDVANLRDVLGDKPSE